MYGQDEDEYVVPLIDQRYFGAGITRQRVKFVTASDSTSSSATSTDAASDELLTPAQRYLNVVLGKKAPRNTTKSPDHAPTSTQAVTTYAPTEPHASPPTQVCEKCQLPITTSTSPDAHASSLAHQTCLPHVHPPSAVDRTRKGLTILRSAGWDPDSRQGLGAAGEGRLFPVSAAQRAEADKAGIGFCPPGVAARARGGMRGTEAETQNHMQRLPTKKLDAGKVLKLYATQKKKAAQLNRLFYADDDVVKYLGEHA